MSNQLRLLIGVLLSALVVTILMVGMARNDEALLAPFRLILFAAGLAIYLLPAALAYGRNCREAVWIAAVNVLLGWTVIGWVATLGWAVSGRVRSGNGVSGTQGNHALQGH